MREVQLILYTWNELFQTARTKNLIDDVNARQKRLVAHDYKTQIPLMGVHLYGDKDPNVMCWDNTIPVVNPAQYLYSVWEANGPE